MGISRPAGRAAEMVNMKMGQNQVINPAHAGVGGGVADAGRARAQGQPVSIRMDSRAGVMIKVPPPPSTSIQ
jgi:hypothetical protein